MWALLYAGSFFHAFLEVTNMPSRPRTPCKHPGCPELVSYGEDYCAKHKPLHPEAVRSAKSRGYDSKWQRFRKRYLAEHCWCVMCLAEGRYEPATVIDHITPFRGDEELKYRLDNLQPLCKYHHDKKTGTSDSHPEYKY